MELKQSHISLMKRLEHSSCSLHDFTHATQAVGNQVYHFEKYLSDLENYGYVILIGDYYHLTGFGAAKLEEKRYPRPRATKISAGTTTEIYDGADLKQSCMRRGAYEFLKYPSKFGEYLVYPKQYV
jgi:hypothetical protein